MRGKEHKESFRTIYTKLKETSGASGRVDDVLRPFRNGLEVPRLYLRHLYGSETVKICIVILPMAGIITQKDEIMPCWYQPMKQIINSKLENYLTQVKVIQKHWMKQRKTFLTHDLPHDTGIWVIDVDWQIIYDYYYTETTVGIPVSSNVIYALSKYGCKNNRATEGLIIKEQQGIKVAHISWNNLPKGDNIIYDDDEKQTAVAYETRLTSIVESGDEIILADTIQEQISVKESDL